MKIWKTLICVLICVVCETFQDNAKLVLTISRSSPPTATNGEPFTLICSISSGPVVDMAWLLNNTSKIITQRSHNCTKQPPPMGENITNRFSVSCNDTVHSIQFIFNSSTDQGGWQCGKSVNDTYISPRSNIYSIDVTSPLTPTRSTLSSSTMTETMSQPGTVTPLTGLTSHVMSTQVSPTATLYTETTSEPGTLTPQKASTDDSDSDTIYIVAMSVGGAAVLLAVFVGAIVCIRRRRQAANHQNDMQETRYVEATPVYQNTTGFHMDSSAPVSKPEKTEQDHPVLSDVVTPQDMYESLTSVEMHIYRRLK